MWLLRGWFAMRPSTRSKSTCAARELPVAEDVVAVEGGKNGQRVVKTLKLPPGVAKAAVAAQRKGEPTTAVTCLFRRRAGHRLVVGVLLVPPAEKPSLRQQRGWQSKRAMMR